MLSLSASEYPWAKYTVTHFTGQHLAGCRVSGLSVNTHSPTVIKTRGKASDWMQQQ